MGEMMRKLLNLLVGTTRFELVTSTMSRSLRKAGIGRYLKRLAILKSRKQTRFFRGQSYCISGLLLASLTASAQPNILYVIADDLGTNGLVGSPSFQPASHNPNLNALAAEGLNFTRAYSPSSQCQPARAALMTNQRPHETGWTHNSWQKRQGFSGTKGDIFSVLGNSTRTLAEDLQAEGYTTASVGKVYHVFTKNPDPRGLDHFERSRKGEKGPTTRIFGAVKVGLTNADFPGTRAAEVAYQAVEWMETLPEPWAIFVGIYPPHLPWMAPEATLAQIGAVGPLAGYLADDTLDTFSYTNNKLRRVTEAEWDESRRWQLASAAHGDEALGVILDAFDRTDTRMVFMSDHGMCMGERENYAAKATLAVCGAHVPYIWAGAGVPQGVDTNPIDTMSAYPALVNNVLPNSGISVPNQGIALSSQGKRHAIRACPDECWSYSRDRNGGEEELYNIDADPHEFNNLAGSHPNELEAMRDLMAAELER